MKKQLENKLFSLTCECYQKMSLSHWLQRVLLCPSWFLWHGAVMKTDSFRAVLTLSKAEQSQIQSGPCGHHYKLLGQTLP